MKRLLLAACCAMLLGTVAAQAAAVEVSTISLKLIKQEVTYDRAAAQYVFKNYVGFEHIGGTYQDWMEDDYTLDVYRLDGESTDNPIRVFDEETYIGFHSPTGNDIWHIDNILCDGASQDFTVLADGTVGDEVLFIDEFAVAKWDYQNGMSCQYYLEEDRVHAKSQTLRVALPPVSLAMFTPTLVKQEATLDESGTTIHYKNYLHFASIKAYGEDVIGADYDLALHYESDVVTGDGIADNIDWVLCPENGEDDWDVYSENGVDMWFYVGDDGTVTPKNDACLVHEFSVPASEVGTDTYVDYFFTHLMGGGVEDMDQRSPSVRVQLPQVEDNGLIPIDEAHFPDANFRAYLTSNTNCYQMIDGDDTKYVQPECTWIECSNKQIADLKGVEYYASLRWLDCYENKLTSLDVSSNTALEHLDCHSNQLPSLDLSKNIKMIYLECSRNQLPSLNMSGCTELTYLYCHNNKLTSLNIGDCEALKYLYCYVNQLPSLDVSNNIELRDLDCNRNQLPSLDVSNNTKLYNLLCYGNQIPSLNVSNNKALTILSCFNNKLPSLDLSSNTELTILRCCSNQLTSLNVSNNTALTELDCHDNLLPSLDVSVCTSLKFLSCHLNQLSSLNVNGFTALTELYCYQNQLTTLDVGGCTSLSFLSCSMNQLKSIDVSSSIKLKYLYCYQNQLTTLDVCNNTSLIDLQFYDNQLTSVDVTNNKALICLRIDNNKLTSIDVSKNTKLPKLSCYNNGNTIPVMHAVNTLKDGKKVDVYYLRLDDVEGSENFITNVVRDLEQWPAGTKFDDVNATGNGFHLSRAYNWVNGEVFSGGRQGNAPRRALADDTYQLVADHVEGDILLLDPNNKRLQYAYDTGNSTVGDVTFTLNWSASGVVTWIDDVEEVKPVAAVQYVNLNGQVSDDPWQGMNVVVTTCTDGTRYTEKRVY